MVKRIVMKAVTQKKWQKVMVDKDITEKQMVDKEETRVIKKFVTQKQMVKEDQVVWEDQEKPGTKTVMIDMKQNIKRTKMVTTTVMQPQVTQKSQTTMKKAWRTVTKTVDQV